MQINETSSFHLFYKTAKRKQVLGATSITGVSNMRPPDGFVKPAVSLKFLYFLLKLSGIKALLPPTVLCPAESFFPTHIL